MAQPSHQFPVQTVQTASQPYSPQAGQSPGSEQLYPPAKRQHLSPNPPPAQQQQQQQGPPRQNMSQQGHSQPGSPYTQAPPHHQSPYGGSPGAAPPSANTPHFQTTQLPQSYSSSPYSNSPYPNGNGTGNGNSTPSHLPPNHNQHMNHNQSLPQSPMGFQGQNHANQQNYNNGMMTPGAGTMGPPSKPADKSKEDLIDPMDVLGGTGVNLQEEEQYQFTTFRESFDTQQTGSFAGYITPNHSFTQFPPGNANTLYGAGPANASGEDTNGTSHEEFEKKAALRAWNDAARDLATSRKNELKNPFLNISRLHTQLQKHTQKANIGINTEKGGGMGMFKLPDDYPTPRVTVQTAMGPNGGLVATSGNFIPADSLLCDQIALLSIAAKHRIRGLLEEAIKLSKARQDGSHGLVPSDWADAAAAVTVDAPAVPEGAIRAGWESAVSPRNDSPKRSFDQAIMESSSTPAQPVKFKNAVVTTLRASAQKERDFEEARIRKRNDRNARASGDTSRQGSIVPGTPGSVAPESSEKAPTKKEARKKAEAKMNEVASHAAANVTTAQFLGGGGGRSLFGKKKKDYSWMTGGGGGSGASTPGRIRTSGLPGTPGGQVGPSAPEKLTADGVRRLGQWREDKEKGRGVQFRDWIYVLEQDGREKMALQRAYAHLDQSEPK